MNRQEWLQERGKSIGASEAAAAIGVSPWQSQRALYEIKVGNVPPDDLSNKEAVYWGGVLESPIRDRVNEVHGQINYDGPYEICRNSSVPFMTCTLDGYFNEPTEQIGELFNGQAIEGKGTLQIKTTSAFSRDEWEDTFPLQYQVQCQHELIVTGCTWGILAVLVGGQELKCLPFIRNEKFCAALIKAEREFWRRVEERDPPEADGSFSTIAVLNQLYPEDSGEEVELPAEALIWDEQMTEAKALKKETEQIIRDCEAKLKDAIGSATYGVLPDGGRWKWATQHRKGYTVQPTTFRVLRRETNNDKD